jgi:hypothetical protein
MSLAAPASAAGTPAACTFAQLKVSGSSGGAGLGHVAELLHFRNSSAVSCSVHGYPGVAGLTKKGRQIQQAERTRSGYLGGLRPHRAIPTVTLGPGQVATAMVEGTDVPPGTATSCRELHGLLVTPPNDKRAARLKVSLPDCSRIQVHPVVKGKTGSQH